MIWNFSHYMAQSKMNIFKYKTEILLVRSKSKRKYAYVFPLINKLFGMITSSKISFDQAIRLATQSGFIFQIELNDLNETIKFIRGDHFVDETNLLLTDNSLKKMNKLINHDLKRLSLYGLEQTQHL